MTRTPVLLANVLVIAVCGLIYELQAATLSSFVLGDSVTQYSLIIGLYLSAMGIGAWLSGFIERGLASGAAARKSGKFVPAAAVLSKLARRLARARKGGAGRTGGKARA